MNEQEVKFDIDSSDDDVWYLSNNWGPHVNTWALKRIMSLRARIAELEAAARPVAFAERWPEDDQVVLVWDGMERFWVYWHYDASDEYGIPNEITYWLPMPPAPGGDA